MNGFGAIGRRYFRIADGRDDLEIVAINALEDPATCAHLLKYDSNYGVWAHDVAPAANGIRVDGRTIAHSSIRDAAEIPWGALGVDVVVDCTGVYTDGDRARAHLSAGAKKVIISAPAEHEDITIVLGVNEKDYRPSEHHIISNASCTTNCLAPVAKVLDDTFGIEHGTMTTAHSYTQDQRLLDFPHKDPRRARAAAENIIPTTTGAAKAIYRVLPQLQGRMDGVSLRVPTPVVSIIDLAFTTKRPITAESVNEAFVEASRGPLGHYLGVTKEPLVSSDFRGDPRSSIVDLPLTMVVGPLGKVMAWYDNEWGYSNRLVELTEFVGAPGL
ncbi:MAG: type I glyceraldehyde-3-phosphate dehydrogenase [Clostridia bacterium]